MKHTLAFLVLTVVAAIGGAYYLTPRQDAAPAEEPAAQATTTPESNIAAVIVPFTKLAKGVHSTVGIRTNYTVSSAEGLAELWKMVKASGKPPKVDFDTKVVVAVFAGEQPTAGYDISVAKVEDADTRTVVVKVAKPDTSCVLAESLTEPYEIIEVPKTSLPFTHEDLSATTSCPK